MKKNFVFILILYLFGIVYSQNCAKPTPSIDLIDFGKTTLVRKTGNRKHCFELAINYRIPVGGKSPDFAVSLSRIQGYNPIAGFDFSVSAGRKTQKNSVQIVVQINQDARWVNLQATYFVSSNPNLIPGSFIANVFQLTQCDRDDTNTAQVETYLPTNRLNPGLNYKAAAFISGFRSFINNFQIKVISSDIDKSDGRLVVRIQSNPNSGIQYVYLSYVVFPTAAINNIQYSLSSTGLPSTYSLQGINSISDNKVISFSQFSACKIVYCPPGQIYINNKCDCAQGFIKVNQACMRQCTQNGYFNQRRECLCIEGFGRNRQGNCVQAAEITQNSGRNINRRNNCDGPNELVMNNRQCGCAFGYMRSNDRCNLICKGQNQVWNGRSCECNSRSSRRNQNQPCLPLALCGQNQVSINGVCQCVGGFTKNASGVCAQIPKQCGRNQFYDQLAKDCICRQGFFRAGLVCMPQKPITPTNGCPPGSSPSRNNICVCTNNFQWNSDKTQCIPPQPLCGPNSSPNNQGKCICNQGYRLNQNNANCVPEPVQCPPNSKLDSQQSCNCNPGFKKSQDGLTCVAAITCPLNSFVGPEGNCVCNNGFYFQKNECLVMPTCPPNSIWSSKQLMCICTIPGQRLNGNVCQACGNNQILDQKKQCICKSGLFKIGGVCRVCDLNSSYNGTDCVCNLGFFGNRDRCQKCDPSCGKCTGPDADKCTTCLDITYTLSNGYCTKNGPCPPGNYLNGASCAKCSDFCLDCVSQLQCAQCADGFSIQLTIVDNLGYSTCQAVCGDGRKVDIQQCDDGNTKNGDGCSTDCSVEQGWSCSGGTSVLPSKCINSIPNKSIIQVKGTVNMVGKVIQGVRLSYIPKCFTDKDCVECFKILDVRVVESSVPAQVTVGFVPNSDGQFVVQYNFGSVITSTFFKYRIQINPNLPNEYKNCFTVEDFAQQLVGTLDTATLAKNDKADTLSLNDLLGEDTLSLPPTPIVPPKNSSNDNKTVLGYPKNVISRLFN